MSTTTDITPEFIPRELLPEQARDLNIAVPATGDTEYGLEVHTADGSVFGATHGAVLQLYGYAGDRATVDAQAEQAFANHKLVKKHSKAKAAREEAEAYDSRARSDGSGFGQKLSAIKVRRTTKREQRYADSLASIKGMLPEEGRYYEAVYASKNIRAEAEEQHETAPMRERFSKIVASAGAAYHQLKTGGVYGATALWANNLSENVTRGFGIAQGELRDFKASPREYFHGEKGKKRIIAASVIGAGAVLTAGVALYIDHKYGSHVHQSHTGGGGRNNSGATATTIPGSRSSTTTTEMTQTTPTPAPEVPHTNGGGVTASNGHHYTRGQVRQLHEALNTEEKRNAFRELVDHPHKADRMFEHGFRQQVHALTSQEFAQLAEHPHKFNHLMEARQQNVIAIRADHPYWSAARVQQAANWLTHIQLEQAAKELADKQAA